MLDDWHGAGGTIRAKNANKKPRRGGVFCVASGKNYLPNIFTNYDLHTATAERAY